MILLILIPFDLLCVSTDIVRRGAAGYVYLINWYSLGFRTLNRVNLEEEEMIWKKKLPRCSVRVTG